MALDEIDGIDLPTINGRKLPAPDRYEGDLEGEGNWPFLERWGDRQVARSSWTAIFQHRN